jgi:hypothetical protein
MMGNEFVGIVHPSKLYNILAVGSPFLYIGPQETHISEIAAANNGEYISYAAIHGDVDAVVNNILLAAQNKDQEIDRRVPRLADTFSKESLLPRMIKLLESEFVHDAEMPTNSGSASRVSAAR